MRNRAIPCHPCPQAAPPKPMPITTPIRVFLGHRLNGGSEGESSVFMNACADQPGIQYFMHGIQCLYTLTLYIANKVDIVSCF
jgi:hypothetical protein